MYKLYLIAGILAVVAIPSFCVTQEQDESRNANAQFMQRKLDYTKEVVAGLAMEDYKRISKGAQDLMLLSHESNWKAVNSPEYLKASSDFRETVQRLRSASNEQNLDGATIAFVEVTFNCVRCHKQLKK